jgi:hypothetical protein
MLQHLQVSLVIYASNLFQMSLRITFNKDEFSNIAKYQVLLSSFLIVFSFILIVFFPKHKVEEKEENEHKNIHTSRSDWEE